MSATEVIEQIKALPRAEQAVVCDFVREIQAQILFEVPVGSRTVKYATADQVKAAGDKVFAPYADVFKKLAE